MSKVKPYIQEFNKICAANPPEFNTDIVKQYWIMEDRARHLGVRIHDLRVVSIHQRIDKLMVLLEGDKDHISALDMHLLNVQESGKFKYKLVLEAKDD